METIAIFALIIALLALIKILVILVKPKVWSNLVKIVWSSSNAMMIICFLLASIVFYYLIQELSIIQIMAVVLFIALLGGMSVAVYSKEIVSLANKMLNDRKFLSKGWLAVLIWLVLISWTLKEILM